MTVGPNDYSKFQKDFYTAETPIMRQRNHSEHNPNPNYWNIMLGDISADPVKWNGKSALDVGCGCGRNLLNLTTLASWGRVDGCDISGPNCTESKSLIESTNWDTQCECYETNGYELNGVPSDSYDFVMSTIVFQHIPVHEIRFNMLSEVFRVMKPGALFSLQMGFGEHDAENRKKFHSEFANYFDNVYEARRTNSGYDVKILDENDLFKDLERIGFRIVDFAITDSWENEQHPKWIWVKVTKP